MTSMERIYAVRDLVPIDSANEYEYFMPITLSNEVWTERLHASYLLRHSINAAVRPFAPTSAASRPRDPIERRSLGDSGRMALAVFGTAVQSDYVLPSERCGFDGEEGHLYGAVAVWNVNLDPAHGLDEECMDYVPQAGRGLVPTPRLEAHVHLRFG